MKKRILIMPLVLIGLMASFGFLLHTEAHQNSNQTTQSANIATAAEINDKQATIQEAEATLPVTKGKAKSHKKATHKVKKHSTKKHSTKKQSAKKRHAKKLAAKKLAAKKLAAKKRAAKKRISARATKKHKAHAKKPAKRTITVKGHTIPWKLDHGAKAAPAHEVGVWYGTGSTTDNETSHFIGHNPGVFHPVMSLRVGNPVKVTDAKGHTKTYHVTKIMDVYDWGLDVRTRRNEDASIFTAPGERITLQTCITETINRIVLAS